MEKKIGIIGAMEMEVAVLKEKMTEANITEKAGMSFHEGLLNDVPVVIVRSGVGKVNAALCLQILVDCFGITHIINTGVAGSLNAKLDIGDILISRDAIQHDVDAAVFGYALGEIPQSGCREFSADEGLVALAKETCERVNPDIHTVVGRVLSGDQFISDKARKEYLISQFAGDCTEMEGAAIAQSAYFNHVPFVIIRSICDKADDSAQMDNLTFEKKAAKQSAALVDDMIRHI